MTNPTPLPEGNVTRWNTPRSRRNTTVATNG